MRACVCVCVWTEGLQCDGMNLTKQAATLWLCACVPQWWQRKQQHTTSGVAMAACIDTVTEKGQSKMIRWLERRPLAELCCVYALVIRVRCLLQTERMALQVRPGERAPVPPLSLILGEAPAHHSHVLFRQEPGTRQNLTPKHQHTVRRTPQHGRESEGGERAAWLGTSIWRV